MSWKILVSNDDGYLSPGLYLLADSVADLGEVLVVSTESPRSATGREITFSKPLRFVRKSWGGWNVYVTDGTPIDGLHLAMEVLNFKPDVVLSGINVGDNLSLQHIFYSGTVALAIEAALMGIPAIAFSSGSESFENFNDLRFRDVASKVARALTEYVLTHNLPEGVNVLSVNIPMTYNNCVYVVKATRLRWRATYVKGVDPRGYDYYWLKVVKTSLEENSDVKKFEEGCVTITPLNIDLNVGIEKYVKLHTLKEFIEEKLQLKT